MTLKRIALIKNGLVQEVVQAGLGYKPPKGSIVVESDSANIGDLYDGSGFSPSDPSRSKEELIAYVGEQRHRAVLSGINFDLAEPGNDPKPIRIRLDPILRQDICDLAYLAQETGKDITLMVRTRALVLSAKQIIDLRNHVAEHVEHCHALAASIIASIDTAHIASIREIESPETATAVKLSSWHKKYA